ncbi:hypothetical protein chiPu_0019868 [Chiloscyllium punctatum]|uniref:Uncharacterized protein n=1 Tax=Chiloscyllium punctatum TaxID=137246 RepID=A0A401RTD4_CHIPU|nr:hypothetical protein [Chiloscyllium punctatum]
MHAARVTNGLLLSRLLVNTRGTDTLFCGMKNASNLHPKLRANLGRIDHVWSQEEVALLRELEVRFAGCKFINKSIASILKTNTPKQISDKCSALANIPMEGQIPNESMTGNDSHESEAESVQENSNDQNPHQSASRRTPASIPKHRDVDNQLTQAEELLSARNDLVTLALGVGLVESITNLLMNNRKRQRKHKRPQKDQAKRHKRTGNNTGAKRRWAARRALFRATQQLYKTNRRQLAREIMGTLTSSTCPLSKEELETCFYKKLSSPNQKSNINK